MASSLRRCELRYCATCGRDTEHEFVSAARPHAGDARCCNERVCDALAANHGQWSVVRHGGTRAHQWRLVEAFEDEEPARALYGDALASLRQGGLRLVTPNGEVARGHCAPRLRTQW